MQVEGIKEVEALGDQISSCYEYFTNNYKDMNFDALEDMLRDIKKVAARATMINIINVIERIVEDGSKSLDGMNKQFNVHSIQIAQDDMVLLVTREILGIDQSDKKCILDSEVTYIDFRNVIRIF